MSREDLQSLEHVSKLVPLTSTPSDEKQKAIENRPLEAPTVEPNDNHTPLYDLNNNNQIFNSNVKQNLGEKRKITYRWKRRGKEKEILSDLYKQVSESPQSMFAYRDKSNVEHSISREIDSKLAHIDIDTFNFRQLPEPLSRLISLIDKNDDHANEDDANHLVFNTKHFNGPPCLQDDSTKSVAEKNCSGGSPNIDTLTNGPNKLIEKAGDPNYDVEITDTFHPILDTAVVDATTDEKRFESLNSEVKYTIAFHDSISSGASSDLSQTLNDTPTVSQCDLVDTNSLSKDEPITVRSQHTDSAINSSITQEEKSDIPKNSYQLLKQNDSSRDYERSSLVEDAEGDKTSQKPQSGAGHLLCQEINANGSLNHVIDHKLERESGHSNTPTNDIYILYPNYSLPDLNFLKSFRENEVGKLITENRRIESKKPEVSSKSVDRTLNIVVRNKPGTRDSALNEQAPSKKLKAMLDRYDSSEHLGMLLPVQVKLLLEKIKSQLNIRRKESFNDHISQSYLNKLNEALELIDAKKQENFTIASGRRYDKLRLAAKSRGNKINNYSGVSNTKKNNLTNELKEKFKQKPQLNFDAQNYLNSHSFLPDNIYKILLISSSTTTRPRPQIRYHETAKVENVIDDDKIDDESIISDSVIDDLSQRLTLPRTVFHVLKILWNLEDKRIIPSGPRPFCHKDVIEIRTRSSESRLILEKKIHTKTFHPSPKPSTIETNLEKDQKTYVVHPTLTRRSKLNVAKTSDATTVVTSAKLRTQREATTAGKLYTHRAINLKNRSTMMNYFGNTCKRSYIPVRIQESHRISDV